MDAYNLEAIMKLFAAKGPGPFSMAEIEQVLAPYDYDITDGFSFGEATDEPT